MFKVTFRSEYQVKQGRKWVTKIPEWTENIKSESDAKLRAMALNWLIIRIEKA